MLRNWQGRSARVVAVAASFILFACKNEKAPTPGPARQPAVDENVETPDPDDADPADVTPQDSEARDLSIKPVGTIGPAFKTQVGSSFTQAFEVSGDDGHEVAVGLYELPTGLTIASSTTTRPSVNWSNPVSGQHGFKFLLRDMDACIAAEGSREACAIKVADYGDLTARTYDTLSDRYVIDVSGNGIGTDLSSDPNGSSNQLISQILQGLGGSGGGGSSGLTQILQGLDPSQLQQILQGQSAGLDINTILQLLGL